MNVEQKRKEAQKITVYGALVNTFIGIVKIVVGILYSSHALVVDGIHSFSDLVTDVFVFFIARFTHEEPDEEHPYGHGRFETLGTVMLGTVLVGVAGIIAYESVVKLVTADAFMIPAWPTLIAAGLSVAMKEWAYRFQVKVGKKIESPLIVANAWHSRSDALSSVAVLIGIVFSMFGLPWIDVVMSIVVAIMIGKIGWEFLWTSIRELVDTSLDAELVEKVKAEILEVDGVVSMHKLRSRRTGDKAILDVNIEVSHHITASEGHEIATYVANNLIKNFDEIIDVTVHTDVEDDRVEGEDYIMVVQELLPLREEVKKEIFSRIEIPELLYMDLHYNGQKMVVDLMFNIKHKDEVLNNEFLEKVNQQCSDIVWLDKIQILVRL